MKAVILAGGLGTRLSELTDVRPKPMVEVGDKPLLWHIMKIYLAHGIDDFIICLGYKGYMIKEYFANYSLHMSDTTFDFKSGRTTMYNNCSESWRVTLVNTGEETQTGGRLRRVAPYLDPDEDFCVTYGDGVAAVDISALIAFHRRIGCQATLTAVQPPGRFGSLEIENHVVNRFVEKPLGDGGWINGGFFVCKKSVLDLIPDDSTIWEREPLQRLAAVGELAAFPHEGFWLPMDTLRDLRQLEALWQSGKAPWKVWQ